MTVATALAQYNALQSKLSAYNHAMSLIFYDGATTAPKKTADNRAHALSVLSEESYRLTTCEETVSLLEFLDAHREELSQKDRRSVELSLKDIRELQKIPMEEFVAYQELLVKADDVWHDAKENNDFASFCPILEEIFATTVRFATYCAPEMHPYNYCLGKYEDGLTMEQCDAFFTALRQKIVPLIKRITRAQQLDNACLHGHFDVSSQEKFARALMRVMGIDEGRCGLGTTEHPFTTSIGSHRDVRITTNYSEEDFSSSMYSVIHEGGHALYDMNSADDLAYTNLDGGVSMGIHESQSRFYENLLGRSEAFVAHIYPDVVACFPEQMKGYTAQDLYRAVNRVEPSLIRVEADEHTYT